MTRLVKELGYRVGEIVLCQPSLPNRSIGLSRTLRTILPLASLELADASGT
jgi:hypothetical protein